MASIGSVVFSEGGLLEFSEAADGTVISGTTDEGSTVEITLTNGSQSLTLEADVTGTSFSLELTEEQLETLGAGFITVQAVATDAGNNTAVSPQSGFLYSPHPRVDPTDRIDGPGYLSPNDGDDDEAITSVIPLAGGGFAVQWAADTNGDDDQDTFAIQRYDAAGNKVGDVVLLSGFLPEHLADEDYGSSLNSIDLTSLSGGGYALTYKLDLFEVERVASATYNGVNPVSFSIVGQAVEVNVYSAPPGATFALSGLQGGVLTTIPLTVEDGVIAISKEDLELFDFPDRVSIAVEGLAQNQQVSLGIASLQTRLYDVGSELQVEARAVTAAANGSAALYDLGGRIESFDIDVAGLQSGGGTITYGMSITPAQGTAGLSVAGIPNAFILSNGSIFINNLAPDANGVIAVPPAILNQLGGNDASVILVINGLSASSAVNATVSVREPIYQPQGVFVQTFDAAGVATGAPTRMDGPGMWGPNDGEEDGQGLTSVVALANGGFAVQWIADTTDDDDGDTYAIQKFDASGTPDGPVVLLTGLPEIVTDSEDGGSSVNSIDLATLEGGGYALTYKLELEEAGRVTTVNGNAQPVLVGIIGRPSEIDIISAPAGATFGLSGTIEGVPTTVALSMGEDNELVITPEILAQFDMPDRLALVVSNMPSGQAQIYIGTLQTRLYDDEGLPAAESVSAVANAGGLAVLSFPGGRVEAFDIESISPPVANPTYVLVLNLPNGPQQINIAGIPGASVTGAGNVQISGLTPDAEGVIAVPQAILDQLDGTDVGVALVVLGLPAGATVNATAAVRFPEVQPEGVYVMSFDSTGAAINGPERVDGPDYLGPYDEDGGMVSVFALPGGGFAAQWIADIGEGDNDGDTYAIQRYDAAGEKVGDVVILDIPELHEDRDGGSELSDVDLAPLENGGYALTYKLALSEIGKFVQITGNGGPINVGLAGRPVELDVLAAPAGASFAVQGVIGGVLTTVPITVVDGEFDFTPEFLAQFDYPDRVGLVVTGVLANQQVQLSLGGLQTRLYDTSDPLLTSALAVTAAPNGAAGLGAPQGRVEAFDINLVTPSGANPTYILVINPAMGAQSINIAGIPGASIQPNGTIIILGVTPNVNGVIAVPPAILSQLGESDAQISLAIQGLVPNSAVNADVLYRAPEYQPEGVFVVTFDENGEVVSNNLDLDGTDDADVLVGDTGDDEIDGLAGNDSISGAAGEDSLNGGTGSDTLSGGSENDLLAGGDDGDLLYGDAGNDTLVGELGADTLVGGIGDDSLIGGDNNDVLDGGTGIDKVFGDAGNDTLNVDDAIVSGDVFNGGANSDTLYVTSGAGIAVDTISGVMHQAGLFQASLVGLERLEFGSASGEHLMIQMLQLQLGSINEVVGGDGNDTLLLVGLGGNPANTYTLTLPTLIKTNWDDPTSLFDSGDRVMLSASGAGHFVMNASAGHTGIELLIGGLGNDTLNGTDGMEMLNGGGGANVLNAGGGDDLLLAVNSTFFGGSETFFNFAGNSFNGGSGTDYLAVGGEVSFQGTLNSIEGIVFQPAFTATGPGAASQDATVLWLDAGKFLGATPELGGNLTLRGEGTLVIELDPGDSFDGSGFVFEAGSSVKVQIEGSDGAAGDVITGTSGDDEIHGEGGQDTVVYSGNRADYTVSFNAGLITVDGAQGSDELDEVELLQFADGTYYWSSTENDLVLAETGLVADGYVAGATVWIDVNDNDILDDGEAYTVTDENGDFVLGSDAVGPIKAMGGTNIDTGRPNELILSAPDNSTVVNPLTTLVQELVENGASESDAEAQVKTAFGIDPSIDLTNDDIIEEAANGNPNALQAQKAAASVAEILDTVNDASSTPEASVQDALDALVTVIEDAEDPIDLADSALLTTVIEAGLPDLDQSQTAALVSNTQTTTQAIKEAESIDEISEIQSNAAPVVVNAIADQNSAEDSAWTFQFAANTFDDEDDDPITYSFVVVDENGDPLGVQPSWINFDAATRTFSGTPPLNFAGDLRIKVIASDGQDTGSDTFTLTIDRVADTVPVSTGTGATEAERIANAYQLPDDIENLTGTGVGQGLIGNALDNLITTGVGDDYVEGGAGDDSLVGNWGDDHLIGGADNDYIKADQGFDRIEGGDGDDELRGNFNADTISGDDGNDSIFAGNGHDVVDGGDGNDTIVGALGHDSLTGGAGADVFVYQAFKEMEAGGQIDKILDFTTGDDKIDLTQLDANSNVDGDQAFVFIGGAAFSGVAGQLRVFDSGQGSWLVQADVDGNGTGDYVFEVFTPANPSTTLVNSDFFL